jgi:hypothetical protein
MDADVPVFSIVKVKTTPVVSLRYWAVGSTEAVASKAAAKARLVSNRKIVRVDMAISRRFLGLDM